MSVRVTVTGVQELRRTLTALGATAARATPAGLRPGAAAIAERARRYCPRRSTGEAHLADNIHVLPSPAAGDVPREDQAVGIGVPERFSYDYKLEFGDNRQSAQPFYRPAIDAEAPTAVAALGRTVWEAVAK